MEDADTIGSANSILLVRFPACMVPSGVNVTSAVVRLVPANRINSCNITVSISAFSISSDATLAHFNLRTTPLLTKSWPISSWGSGVIESTPDITRIISSVTRDASWSPGTDLVLELRLAHGTNSTRYVIITSLSAISHAHVIFRPAFKSDAANAPTLAVAFNGVQNVVNDLQPIWVCAHPLQSGCSDASSAICFQVLLSYCSYFGVNMARNQTDSHVLSDGYVLVTESDFAYSASFFSDAYCDSKSFVSNTSTPLTLGACGSYFPSAVSLHLNCPGSTCVAFETASNLLKSAAINYEYPAILSSSAAFYPPAIIDDTTNPLINTTSPQSLSLWRIVSQPVRGPLSLIAPNTSVAQRSLLTRFNSSFANCSAILVYRLPVPAPRTYNIQLRFACFAPSAGLIGNSTTVNLIASGITFSTSCSYAANTTTLVWKNTYGAFNFDSRSLEVQLGYVIVQVVAPSPGVLFDAIALIPLDLNPTEAALDGVEAVSCTEYTDFAGCPIPRCNYDLNRNVCFDPTAPVVCARHNGDPWNCPTSSCVYDFAIRTCSDIVSSPCACISPCVTDSSFPLPVCTVSDECDCVSLSSRSRSMRWCQLPVTNALNVSSSSPYVPSGVYQATTNYDMPYLGFSIICDSYPVWAPVNLTSSSSVLTTNILSGFEGDMFWAFVDIGVLSTEYAFRLLSFSWLATSGSLRAGIIWNATDVSDLPGSGWLQNDVHSASATIVVQKICAAPLNWTVTPLNATSATLSVSLTEIPPFVPLTVRGQLISDESATTFGSYFVSYLTSNFVVGPLLAGSTYKFWLFFSDGQCIMNDDVESFGGSKLSVNMPSSNVPITPAAGSVTVNAIDSSSFQVSISSQSDVDITAFLVSYRRVPGQPNADPARLASETFSSLLRPSFGGDASSRRRRSIVAETSSQSDVIPCTLDATTFVPVVPHAASTVISGLESGVMYEVKVASVSALATSKFTAATPVVTYSSAPSVAPSNVRASVLSATRGRVTWNTIPAADQNGLLSYVVAYAPVNNITQRTLIDVGNVTSYSLHLPVAATGYAVYIGAYNRANAPCSNGLECFPSPLFGVKAYGPWSDPVPLALYLTAPGMPLNVVAANIGGNLVQVTWLPPDPVSTPANTVASYILYYRVLADSNNRTVPFGAETALPFNSAGAFLRNLPPNTLLAVQVAAVSTSIPPQIGARSPSVSILTAEALCGAPTGIVAAGAGVFSIAVSWMTPDPLMCIATAYVVAVIVVDSNHSFSILLPFSLASPALAILDGFSPAANVSISIAARSALGIGAYSAAVYAQPGLVISAAGSSSGVSAGAVAGILIALIIVVTVVALYLYRRHHLQKKHGIVNTRLRRNKTDYGSIKADMQKSFVQKYPQLAGNARVAFSSTASLERDWPAITLGKELGSGSYGAVRLAHIADALGHSQVVALKALRDEHTPDEFLAFFSSATLLNAIQHDNIIELMAVNTLEEPFFMAVEYMIEV